MKTSTFRTLAITGIVLGLVGGIAVLPAASHHSFAMYDQTVERTLTGKLARFVVGANHSQFIFELLDGHGNVVVDGSGEPVMWQVETGPATSLARQGITPNTFPIDTVFTVTLYPMRNGQPAGALRGDLIICGETMPEGGCNAETGKVF